MNTAAHLAPHEQPVGRYVLAGRPLQEGMRLEETAVFEDDVWRLTPALLRADRHSLALDFTTLPTSRVLVAKQLCFALLTQDTPPGETPISITSIRTYFSSVRRFLLWVNARDMALAEVDPQDLTAYHEDVVALRLQLAGTNTHRRCVRMLWAYRTRLHDHLTVDPLRVPAWQAWSRAQHRGRGENRTDRIPEHVMAPLLTWALRWVDDFADDVLAACRERDALDARPPDGPDPLASLQRLLAGFHARNQPLPIPPARLRGKHGIKPCVGYLARLIGHRGKRLETKAAATLIHEAARTLGLDTGSYLDHRERGTLDGQPWHGAISYYDVAPYERLLQASCWVTIGYLSGMRDSEIKHLQRGCVRVLRDPQGRIYRHHVQSLAFKGENDPRGVPATWIVTAPVARAVAVLERLQPDDQPYLFALPRSSRRAATVAGEVPGSNSTASGLSALMTWINQYCTRNDRADAIPQVRGRQPHLTNRQFRRTLAWFNPRRPGGTIAGALQYRHQCIQMFEGYAGTSDSGFRDEVQAEQALTRGQFLADLSADSDRPRLTGPAATEAEQRLAAYAPHVDFPGQVVVDEARLRRIMARHDPRIYPGAFVTCVYNPDRALCRREGADAGEPVLGGCQPLACRNTALTEANRDALADQLTDLHSTLNDGDHLAPYVRHRLDQQRQTTADFLTRHRPEPA
ncbi:hypothetical protein [Streptomyces sp. SID13588]|uniref:hypothetical protein n=1 Tax=Streptomyces sp. SID13588 TaxID=2706051 RepID=UPI0013C9A035|nr:hypothetical protein [Streptomyces sp. SID13588]NEA76556.1 hypothetical protein [Streptomyces sp. SID13588]